jgi:hypothetical protein
VTTTDSPAEFVADPSSRVPVLTHSARADAMSVRASDATHSLAFDDVIEVPLLTHPSDRDAMSEFARPGTRGEPTDEASDRCRYRRLQEQALVRLNAGEAAPNDGSGAAGVHGATGSDRPYIRPGDRHERAPNVAACRSVRFGSFDGLLAGGPAY